MALLKWDDHLQKRIGKRRDLTTEIVGYGPKPSTFKARYGETKEKPLEYMYQAPSSVSFTGCWVLDPRYVSWRENRPVAWSSRSSQHVPKNPLFEAQLRVASLTNGDYLPLADLLLGHICIPS